MFRSIDSRRITGDRGVDQAPAWNDIITLAVPADGCRIRVEVMDEDKGMRDDFLGQCEIDLQTGSAAWDSKRTIQLADKDGKKTSADPLGNLTLWIGERAERPDLSAFRCETLPFGLKKTAPSQATPARSQGPT